MWNRKKKRAVMMLMMMFLLLYGREVKEKVERRGRGRGKLITT